LIISIITINLNNSAGLEMTIKSIINQDFQQFEFIVVDGGSNDGSLELLERYSEHIKYWKSEPDHGIYQAMNKGIKKAVGEYCLFVNSGDVLNNENVLTEMTNQQLSADIIAGNAFVNKENVKPQLVKAPEIISFYTFFQHTILHQSTLIRTSLFKELGYYNENLKIVADWEFFVRALFLHNCTYKAIDLTISVFDITGISSQPENFTISLKERKEVLEKFFPYFIADYKLLQPRSTFVFHQNIQKSKILRSLFIFTSRLVNKFFRLLSR
jgi:glycosyltransferase involved in cell wall biosynthesis